jgi:hypothetical protein
VLVVTELVLDSYDEAQVYDLAAEVCQTWGNLSNTMKHKLLISQNKKITIS